MQITKDNYFEVNNHALTNSKMKDFTICKNYFYRKHIKGEIERENKSHFAVGGAVDDLLTQVRSKDKYVVVKRRNLKNPPDGVIEVNEAQYEEIMGLASAVENTTAWKDLHKLNGSFQEILCVPYDLGKHFNCLAGIPDHYYIDDDTSTCYITDLKTTQTINPDKFYWTCKEYGYFKQLAFYKYLIHKLNPDIKHFECRIIAVEKRKDVWGVETFVLSPKEIQCAHDEVMSLIEQIKQEKEFKKRDATWEDAIIIGANSMELE